MSDDPQVMSTTKSLRSVYILGRPYSFFPPLGLAAHAHFYLCHWGVLVTELTVIDIESVVFQTKSLTPLENPEIGSMFELNRTAENRIMLECIRRFTLSILNKHWRNLAIHYVGMTDMPDERIQAEGRSQGIVELII